MGLDTGRFTRRIGIKRSNIKDLKGLRDLQMQYKNSLYLKHLSTELDRKSNQPVVKDLNLDKKKPKKKVKFLIEEVDYIAHKQESAISKSSSPSPSSKPKKKKKKRKKKVPKELIRQSIIEQKQLKLE